MQAIFSALLPIDLPLESIFPSALVKIHQIGSAAESELYLDNVNRYARIVSNTGTIGIQTLFAISEAFAGGSIKCQHLSAL